MAKLNEIGGTAKIFSENLNTKGPDVAENLGKVIDTIVQATGDTSANVGAMRHEVGEHMHKFMIAQREKATSQDIVGLKDSVGAVSEAVEGLKTSIETGLSRLLHSTQNDSQVLTKAVESSGNNLVATVRAQTEAFTGDFANQSQVITAAIENQNKVIEESSKSIMDKLSHIDFKSLLILSSSAAAVLGIFLLLKNNRACCSNNSYTTELTERISDSTRLLFDKQAHMMEVITDKQNQIAQSIVENQAQLQNTMILAVKFIVFVSASGVVVCIMYFIYKSIRTRRLRRLENY